MEETQFEQDCKIFEVLIERGKVLTEDAPSITGADFKYALKSEQYCHRWFIETKNFLIALFGEDYSDIRIFRERFRSYSFTNLSGIYSGDLTFIKEDMHKGVGVLEGIYYSFKNKRIKRKEELIKSLKKSPDRIRVMFDNDVLNKLLEREIDLGKITKSNRFEFYATHIQIDQANRCKDEDKRARLSLLTTLISPKIIDTESFVLGKSRLGFAKLSDGKELEELKKENTRHTEDALIGETAIKNRILLVTNDKTLKSRVNARGGRAINLEQFKEILG